MIGGGLTVFCLLIIIIVTTSVLTARKSTTIAPYNLTSEQRVLLLRNRTERGWRLVGGWFFITGHLMLMFLKITKIIHPYKCKENVLKLKYGVYVNN